ncbi:papain-like cysteine protease family protein [Streptomyces sp. UNOB3_S3]|uniref:papain-like cysteine protease family protein n=1 Tax=Streptomyces sp. UNOB3_S3 TaxID=2871682 RepID=UPI001E4A9041|nr:papain-like cysteine protease family protein [Streptomyces sp. UNOB3_S3]MCC3778731.1 C39 family peptidase [Streptomyces sp. UNOB3_S3]
MSRASASATTEKARIRGRRLSLTALFAAALFAVPTTASAAPGEQPALRAANKLNIGMQAQQQTNWCWAASGNTIATWFGRKYSQNQFCNAAFNRAQGSTCPNNQATLGNVQNALDWAGINEGRYVNGWLRYSTVKSEIDAGRPVETRIQWQSGGGHMHVIYGYDDANSMVYWGDPWPSSNRYNWASHNWYVNNNQFAWTHSLYGIGA